MTQYNENESNMKSLIKVEMNWVSFIFGNLTIMFAL